LTLTLQPRPGRIVFALLAICASLVVTALSLTPLHGHAQARSCEVCQTAHLPFIQPTVAGIERAAPPVAPERPAEYSPQALELACIPRDSRGPPAGSLAFE
jgi:hypothetical protein